MLLPFYTFLINQSLTLGKFPQSEKQGIITPVLKTNKNKNELSSYRPITNLTFLSKLIENAAHLELTNYLRNAKLLPTFQSAYRKNCSTTTALLKVHNDLIDAIAEGKTIVYLALDLSSAFDTIITSNLLKVLIKNGIEGDVLKWFTSYLTERTVKVLINKKESKEMTLIEIPQGGVLSPTLFSLFTADICEVLNKHGVKYHLYADDVQIYFYMENFNIEKIQEKLNNIMSDIVNYMIENP